MNICHILSPECLRILVTRTYNENPSNIEKKAFVSLPKNNDDKEKEGKRKLKTIKKEKKARSQRQHLIWEVKLFLKVNILANLMIISIIKRKI